MKITLLVALLSLSPDGDREKGMQLYRERRYADAVVAFRAAIASEGDSPELQYNLALACWQAGLLADAETAVEKYAASAGKPRPELHAGVLGAVRFGEAKAFEKTADELLATPGGAPTAPGDPPPPPPPDPLVILEQAQQKATQAKDHFVRGASTAPSPELLRNTERTLQYLDLLQKKIDDLKKQREEQKKDQEQKDSDKKDDKQSKDDQQKSDQDQKNDQQKQDQQKQDPGQKDDGKQQKPPEGQEGESKPEPKPDGKSDDKQQPNSGEGKPDEQKPPEGKPEEQKSPEQKPAEQQQEPKDGKDDGKPRTDAPGEAVEGRELTAEQTQRLFDQLQNLDQKLKEFRARGKSGRRTVERDW